MLDLHIKEIVMLESELLAKQICRHRIELEENVGKEKSTENCLWNSI